MIARYEVFQCMILLIQQEFGAHSLNGTSLVPVVGDVS